MPAPVQVIAHAGAQARAPQDTLPAFRLALEIGADAIELDVQRSADGHAVLLHDATVDRTTDGSGPVGSYTLEELRTLDAGYRFVDAQGRRPWRGQGVRIPTLAEALDLLAGVPLVIELKRDAGEAIIETVATLLEKRGALENVLLASFDDTLLAAARRRLPHVATSFAEEELRAFVLASLSGDVETSALPPSRVIQIPDTYEGMVVPTPELVADASRCGLDVHVWTVNDTDRMTELVAMGVGGIVTDHPERARAVVDAG